jgi:hypothetical protein
MRKATLNDIKPGKVVYKQYYPGNRNNLRMHIRAVVDDEMVVYCFWVPGKHRWGYHITYRIDFVLMIENGSLFFVGDEKCL